MDKSTLMALIMACILVIVNAATIAQYYPVSDSRPPNGTRPDDDTGETRDVSQHEVAP
jgi:hypothetical protein